jgi:hypothetical protein
VQTDLRTDKGTKYNLLVSAAVGYLPVLPGPEISGFQLSTEDSMKFFSG